MEKLDIVNMHGRPVILIEDCFPHGHCADCGYEPHFKVFELNGKTWYWCGKCDVGG